MIKVDGRDYEKYSDYTNQELVEKLLSPECDSIYIIDVEDGKEFQRKIINIRISKDSEEHIVAYFEENSWIKARIHKFDDFGKTWSFEKLI